MQTVSERHDASFIIRIWWERRETPQAEPLWRGYIQHVQSNQAIYFSRHGELATFLQQWTGDLASTRSGEGDEPVLYKSTEVRTT